MMDINPSAENQELEAFCMALERLGSTREPPPGLIESMMQEIRELYPESPEQLSTRIAEGKYAIGAAQAAGPLTQEPPIEEGLWAKARAYLRAIFYRHVMDRAATMPPGPRRWALPALATCLVLSLTVNIWLGERFYSPAGSGDTRGSADTRAKIRLAFADNVREQDVRVLLLHLSATIVAGPSLQGVYIVQVPLRPLLIHPTQVGRAVPPSEDPMRLLLEKLRAYPAVRLAEPFSPRE